ncbi:alpha/beta hydrolase [Nocardia sp. NPDC127606]|uniref:poly(ethylene terephthalate) hydrolase family protein n=1 Tax=Nocardia sp. NPDC127606 TaxID=3345406 RepID=UPI003640BBC6
MFRSTVLRIMTVGMAVAMCSGVATAQPTDHEEPPTSTGPFGVWPKTVQGEIHREFARTGEHEVAVSQELHPCDDLYGTMQRVGFWLAGGNDMDKMRCTYAFPHGLDSPIGMLYYSPRDLQTMDAAPVLVWLPGLDGDAGQYDAIARLWASRGFVVAIPYNFVNSFPTDDIWGIQALLAEEARPESPLHGKVDFARTMLGGHSGGAGATFWAASYLPGNVHLLDPRLRIIGALSVATGIQAPTGLNVTVPTLTITGNLDIITPDMLWPRWVDYKTIFQAPAYIATAINATHFAVNGDLPNNPVAGLSTAWLEHLAGTNPAADQVFVGPDWSLPHDGAFMAVERNAPAEQVR